MGLAAANHHARWDGMSVLRGRRRGARSYAEKLHRLIRSVNVWFCSAVARCAMPHFSPLELALEAMVLRVSLNKCHRGSRSRTTFPEAVRGSDSTNRIVVGHL
jgi:hypothetical protein